MLNKLNSSLWEFAYAPQHIQEMILPEHYKNMFSKMVEKQEIDNLILTGNPGCGKTTVANILCKDINVEFLQINASKDTSVDIIRTKVEQFATSCSFDGSKKVIVFSEAECLTNNVGNGAGSQNALKDIIEAVESKCRFIFTTNDLSGMNSAIISRCKVVDFKFTIDDKKEMVKQFFKRMCEMLETEKVVYDKKILGELIVKKFPDFRKIIVDLQTAYNMYNCINEQIFSLNSNEKIKRLIEEMKSNKINLVRKTIEELDISNFYDDLYTNLNGVIQDNCIPELVLILADRQADAGVSINKKLPAFAACIEIMKSVKWS